VITYCPVLYFAISAISYNSILPCWMFSLILPNDGTKPPAPVGLKKNLSLDLDLEFVFLFKAVSRSASAICQASLLLKNWVVI
jgi:hypothetical protein